MMSWDPPMFNFWILAGQPTNHSGGGIQCSTTMVFVNWSIQYIKICLTSLTSLCIPTQPTYVASLVGRGRRQKSSEPNRAKSSIICVLLFHTPFTCIFKHCCISRKKKAKKGHSTSGSHSLGYTGWTFCMLLFNGLEYSCLYKRRVSYKPIEAPSAAHKSSS